MNVSSNKEFPSGCVLIEAHYLPCIAYFACITSADSIILEACEHYVKQSYRNRCRILTANKIVTLSVPVHKGSRRRPIREVKIDYSQSWLKDHWRTIASAYGKAPFFEEYSPYFEKALLKKNQYLFDLNVELLTICLRLLNLSRQVASTDTFEERLASAVNDYRNAITTNNTGFATSQYVDVRYRQNFGSNFVPNLSILDLLFCQGPQAVQVIRQSIVNF